MSENLYKDFKKFDCLGNLSFLFYKENHRRIIICNIHGHYNLIVGFSATLEDK